MTNATALLVGLKQVDPGSYGGWTGEAGCWGCENDVDNIEDILRPLGYKFDILKTKKATAENILSALQSAAAQLVDGDIFVFYFSGHGGQQPDQNGDELDGKDETLVAYNRQISDDELDEIWLMMKPGVRIVMLSDSCNSGTNYRNKGLFDQSTPFIPVAKEAVKRDMNAQLIHFGGCRDGLSSVGYEEGGAFTIAVSKSWQNGTFVGNYNDFYEMICQKILGTTQKPQYNEYGSVSRQFREQRPFTLESVEPSPSVPNAWVIGTNKVSGGYGIFHLTSSGWQPIQGGAVRIAVAPDGHPWVVNEKGMIYQHTTDKGWVRLQGEAKDIDIGADGSVWVVGTNKVNGGYGIFHLTSSGWQPIQGGAVGIAVAPDGHPWVVNEEGMIYQHTTDKGWVRLQGEAKDINLV